MNSEKIYTNLESFFLSDFKIEVLLDRVRKNPISFFAFIWWLLTGRINEHILLSTDIEIDSIPLRNNLIDLLKREKAKGKEIILVSRYHACVTQKVFEGLGIHDKIIYISSSQSHNLHELKDIIIEDSNHRPFACLFTYPNQEVIWDYCHEVIIAEPKVDNPTWFEVNPHVTKIPCYERQGSKLRALFSLLRIHQWAKNSFLFLPLLTAHINDMGPWLLTSMAFFAFSFTASAVYIINDLLDLESDRQSQEKKHRALASGRCSLDTGFIFVPLLLIAAIAIACYLPLAFIKVLIIYFIITCLYSFGLKKKVLLDTFILSLLYTMRLLAGGAVAGIEISYWLLSLSLFFFFGLAQLKRYAELSKLSSEDQFVSGRKYSYSDRSLVLILGVSSGFLSVLIFVLYINSDKVVQLYEHPNRLWLFSPCLLYWTTRNWFKAHHGKINEDPVIFAIKDPTSYLMLILMLIISYSAI